MDTNSRTLKLLAGGGLVLAGVGVGTVLAVTGSASASTDTAYGSGYRHSAHQGDPSESQRTDEKPLTGTTAAKVRAAALAKYPGATIQRVETDSDGVYEAHVVTKAGPETIVQVGKDFAVTGTQTGGGPGGGPGGQHGDHDGDGPDGSGESGGA